MEKEELNVELSAVVIANFFIKKGIEYGKPINPMKLQKLLYFAYGWHLGYFKNKLFKEDIEAWKFGPVVKEIYHLVKKYGNFEITELIPNIPEKKVTPDLDKFLTEIWNVYSPFSAINLSAQTHVKNSPWHKTVKGYSVIPLDLKINDADIEDFFLKLKEQAT